MIGCFYTFFTGGVVCVLDVVTGCCTTCLDKCCFNLTGVKRTCLHGGIECTTIALRSMPPDVGGILCYNIVAII